MAQERRTANIARQREQKRQVRAGETARQLTVMREIRVSKSAEQRCATNLAV